MQASLYPLDSLKWPFHIELSIHLFPYIYALYTIWEHFFSYHSDWKGDILVSLSEKDQKYFICNSALFPMIFKWLTRHSCGGHICSYLFKLKLNSVFFFMERDIDKDFLHNFIEILFQKYTLLCILRDYCTLFCLKSYPGLFSISPFWQNHFCNSKLFIEFESPVLHTWIR